MITTNGTDVLCIPSRDSSRLAPCDHEEADTRLILHLADAVNEGFCTILLCTVDSDIVILAVAAASKLDVQELWVAFGTGKNFRYMYLLMKLLHLLVLTSPRLCLCFMLTRGVTQLPRSTQAARRQCGRLGSF